MCCRLSNRLQSTQGSSVDSDLVIRRIRDLNDTMHNQYLQTDYKIERLRLNQMALSRNISINNNTFDTRYDSIVADIELLRLNQVGKSRFFSF